MPPSIDQQDDTPSPRHQRLMLAALIANRRDDDWPELDTSLLDDKRPPVPAFPLDLLPPPWRDWIADTALSVGAAPDYVVQSVLAAMAGLCGAGVRVRVTPAWSEPMVLWQMPVGPPSAGKSRALAPLRRLLATLVEERRAGADRAKPSPFVFGEAAPEALRDAVAAHPQGILVWRDEPMGDVATVAGWRDGWAAGEVAFRRPHGPPLAPMRAPISLLATVLPERLGETLADDHGLAARLLYAWPQLANWCPLAERPALREDEALKRLRRVMQRVGTPDDPLELVVDTHGQKAFDSVLAGLQADLATAEGLEACWLGNGPGTVARLAGVLELLGWSGLTSAGRPGAIGRAHVEAAAALWSDYFRPHARAAFQQTAPDGFRDRLRRAARWLKAAGRTEVSREDIRRVALSQSVTAGEAEGVIGCLTAAGMLRRIDSDSPRRGPPMRRWQVNPALTEMV
jgi:hypothetical protein